MEPDQPALHIAEGDKKACHGADLKILDKPRVLGGPRANILAQMAAIALLLKRAFSFIIRITNQFRKLHQTNDPAIKEKLKPPFIHKSIRNVIQME